MGISASVLRVTDEQIQDFTRDPSRAESLFIGCINFDEKKCCHLHDYWDGLHYLLTGEAEGRDLPLCAIKRGDVAYPGAVHALYSTTTKALAQKLNTFSEEELRERFDPVSMMTAARGGRPVYPGRYWVFPELAQDTFRDLLYYFGRLRDFSMEAAGQNKGLLFHRYEDF